MNNFWKPRSINIVDVVIILLILLSLFLMYWELDTAQESQRIKYMMLNSDIFMTYEQVQEIKSVLNME